MPSSQVSYHELYAQLLSNLGYGRALWRPEPNNRNREVLIGDVGRLSNGAFRPIFNSMRPRDHVVNSEGVPSGFTMLQDVDVDEGAMFCSSVIGSAYMHGKKVQGDITGAAPIPGAWQDASVTCRWTFQSVHSSGAFVLLDPPAFLQAIDSSLLIDQYMKENFQSWVEFANVQRHLGIPEKDLLFISGTLKTTHWAVAVFQGPESSELDVSVAGQLGSVANLDVSVHSANAHLVTPHYNTGPLEQQPVPPVRNQTLFIHYYKMVRRGFWRVPIKAAAGPHNLPPSNGNNGGAAGEVEEDGHNIIYSYSKYDPVNDILDYILETSNAEVAIASTHDIQALQLKFEDSTVFYEDVSKAIKFLSPAVIVDADGFGKISQHLYRCTTSNGSAGVQEYSTSYNSSVKAAGLKGIAWDIIETIGQLVKKQV